MTAPRYNITLTPDEEKVAQLLTRDAWGYFSSLITSRDIFHIKDIPMMPRQGTFSLAADDELIQYYLDFAGAYAQELALYGWEAARVAAAAQSFVTKLEEATGQLPAAGRSKNGVSIAS